MTDLRLDRDRFVAFAFASADLLIELEPDWRVATASGAVKSLWGRDAGAIVGKPFFDLVAARDRALVRHLAKGLPRSGRLDPVTIRLDHPSGVLPSVLMGCCALPSVPGRIFVTLTLLRGIGGEDAPRDKATGLLAKEALLKAASASSADGGDPRPRHLALVRLDGLDKAAHELPEAQAQNLMEEIGAVLRARSVGGDSAGRLGADEFGVVRLGAPDISALAQDVGEVMRGAGLREGAVETRVASLDLAVGQLDERDAAKAIAYAVKTFSDKSGGDFTLSSLKDGLSAVMSRTVAQFGDLRRVIEKGGFQLVFQPIVLIKDREVHHYEALSRFEDGKSPYEIITFGEEVGLIQELDLAVCRKALTELARTTGPGVAVNVSGQSVQSEAFRSALTELLKPHAALRERFIFELTESAGIERVDEAVKFLDWLRAEGHAVCLDDFGAGAAAYNYLRHFDVDFVKIDGPFLKAALENERERALVQSICQLCEELGSHTIGEMIEDEAAAKTAARLGIKYGQGWLYGKPLPSLPALMSATPQRAAKRKGFVTRWE